MADLILAIASSRGSTPEIAKKQVCSTVLVRPASPASRAIRPASIAYTSIRFARTFSWTGRGSASHTSSGGWVQLSSSVAPRAARPSEQPEVRAADEARLLHQVRRADRLRAETQMRHGLRARLLRVIDEVPL